MSSLVICVLLGISLWGCKSTTVQTEAKDIPIGDGENLVLEFARHCEEATNSFKNRKIQPFLECHVDFEKSLWHRIMRTEQYIHWAFVVGPNKIFRPEEYPYEVQFCISDYGRPAAEEASVQFYVAKGEIDPKRGVNINNFSFYDFGKNEGVEMREENVYPIKTGPLKDGKYHGSLSYNANKLKQKITCTPVN